MKRSNIVRAVNDISFSVNQGEILGKVGRNGSGKTMLIRSVAGIFQPDERTIDTHGNRVSLRQSVLDLMAIIQGVRIFQNQVCFLAVSLIM